jgi:tRNA threonylcarbamoyl adenosine modification protein (Sua5/YciO/YrdC/YwlC family)
MRVFTEFNKELTNIIKDGAVGVLPTDTVYGLVCQASNEQAVARLYKLKPREHKPGTIIAANMSQLVELGIKYRYLKAVENFWPGAVSVIIPCTGLDYLRQGALGLAVRIPDDKDLQKLLERTGALLTTSANHPDQLPANTLVEAQGYFDQQVDFYVDGGDLSNHEPSTIIRIVDDAIEIVRAGAVKIDATGRIK